MFTLWVASRWLKAVSSAPTRPSAPPSWNTMQYDFGEVRLEACSISVSIAGSVSSGSSTDFDAPVACLKGGLGSYGVSLRCQQRDQLVGHQLEMSERPLMPDPRNPVPEGQLVKRAVLA